MTQGPTLPALTRRKRRKWAAGAHPGTLIPDPSAAPTKMRAFLYGPEQFEERSIEAKDLPGLSAKAPVVWLDIAGLGSVEVIRKVGETFHLHPLALEDAVNVHQRAKAEAYPEHEYVVARMVNHLDILELEQLSLFVGRNFLVTIQEMPGDCFEPLRERLRRADDPVRKMGPDALAYLLLDRLIDSYFPILEAYGEKLDALEDQTLLSSRPEHLRHLHRIKRDLFQFRRAAWPLRDMLNALARETNQLFAAETKLYLRDCYDHAVQIIDLLETYRELTSDLMDLQLSSMSNRMNEVMRVVTIIATIFIPMTFIASIYGMNFKHMPELGWRWGYYAALAIMALVGLSLLAWFWRKGWLRSFLPERPNP
jgi:magnesium transporter